MAAIFCVPTHFVGDTLFGATPANFHKFIKYPYITHKRQNDFYLGTMMNPHEFPPISLKS